MNKIKESNPEKLKEWRHNAYINGRQTIYGFKWEYIDK